jgi:zinc-binding in reverse transcriptase
MPIKQQSAVWKEINDLSQLGQTGSSVVLSNGQDIVFWLDRWAGDCALSSQFHHLFQLCEHSLILVFTVVMSAGQTLKFKRLLSGVLLLEFNSLCTMVGKISLSLDRDKLRWWLSESGKFTISEVYSWFTFRGVTDSSADIWWTLPIPLIVKVFMWLVTQNKILTKHNLMKRGWVGSTLCTMCDETETVSHLFLMCNFAEQIWFWMGKCQHYYIYWNNFSNVMAFAATLSGNMQKYFLVVLSSVCWSLWKHHNFMVFEKVAASLVRN